MAGAVSRADLRRPWRGPPSVECEAIARLARADKIAPMLSTESTESTDPADPTDKIEPAEPIDKIEPAEPTDKIEPTEPTDRIEPDEPMDNSDRAEPIESSDLPREPISALSQQAGPDATPRDCPHLPLVSEDRTRQSATPAMCHRWGWPGSAKAWARTIDYALVS